MPANFKSATDATTCGAALRRAREANGLSLLDLAGLIGVHHSQISRIERGHFRRLSNNVQTLCTFLDVEHPMRRRISAQLTVESLQQRVAQSVAAAPHRMRLIAAFLDALGSELT